MFFVPIFGGSSDSDSEEEPITEEELAKLKEEVEEKKKLIATLRNKPWKMKKKLSVLKYGLNFIISICHPSSYYLLFSTVAKFMLAIASNDKFKLFSRKNDAT